MTFGSSVIRNYLSTFIACAVLGFSTNSYADELNTVKVAMVNFVGDATLYYAYREGYFIDEGLDIELVHNSAGVESMKQVIAGEVHIGTVAPTPIVYLAQGRISLPNDIRIVANIYRSSNLNSLVILDSEQNPDPASLVGKKLGLQQQTAAEYFWYRVTVANNINPDDIEIVNIPTRNLAQASQQGLIDAAIVWSPFHLDVYKAVKTKPKVIRGTTYATEGWYVVTHPDFLEQHPQIVEKYLSALKRAEQDIRSNPDKVALYHSEIVDSSPEELSELYGDISFSLNLAESDLFHLEQQGKWAYRVGYVDQAPIDYRQYVETGPLSKVSPDSIKLLE
ncbi:ABC transporter substrate-binding protein [Alginatibacterium sediminis]|uniref:ABC transporter substrate-binding protein n=1 Tax=Alginatibacterium sediminis TaxID=2164068 RepID=A0A420EH31_9ALTE|nr:ABC transporter substrate-binding protein [Alginatibacterium sediminis]RKF19977.1 ABC transporter substrate-binding protein [Alginatibacterium sediminis]